MKQAIAGVAPASLDEVTAMVVWPTISASAAGQTIGRLCSAGGKSPFAIGKLLAPLMIAPALALFFLAIVPPFPFPFPFNRRYKITNRRILVLEDHLEWLVYHPFGIPFPAQKIRTAESKTVQLDRFDTIEIEVLPGQQWYPAGELIFKQGAVETFRLSGVSRPEAFRQICMKARNSYVLVNEALKQQS